MLCPFQYLETKGPGGSSRSFSMCSGSRCAAYVPAKAVGSFTIPARCNLMGNDKSQPIAPAPLISEKTLDALLSMGIQTHREG